MEKASKQGGPYFAPELFGRACEGPHMETVLLRYVVPWGPKGHGVCAHRHFCRGCRGELCVHDPAPAGGGGRGAAGLVEPAAAVETPLAAPPPPNIVVGAGNPLAVSGVAHWYSTTCFGRRAPACAACAACAFRK